MKQISLSIFCLASFAGFANAAVFSSNFDSSPYNFGSSLVPGLIDGWSVSGASLSGVATIRSSPFPSPVSGSQALHFGFEEIDAASAYLFRSDGSGLVGNSAGYTQFQTAFIVQDSEPTFVNRDSFAFTFRGAANENLLTVQLAPTSQSAAPQGVTPPRVDQFSWTSDFGAGNANIGTLSEGQWSTLNVLFTPSGVNDVAFSVKFQGVEFASGVLAGAGTQVLQTYGMVWTPLDASNEGSNVLIIDDISLVPEPSSSLLICLAGLGFVARRKRA